MDGSDGNNAYTALSSAFTQPAVSATSIAVVVSSDWAVVGEDVFLEGGGYYLVTAIPDSTHVTLQNRGYTANSVPGTIIPISSALSPSGEKGATGSAAGGSLLSVNNLNDVANVAASRTNLGLGTMAVETATDYLTKAGNLTGLANPATSRTNLGVAIGVNVQAYDADLTTWAGVSPSANVLTFVGSANNAAMRTALGVITDQFALYEHQQASGVDGGTFTSGAWRVVPLTTEVADTGNNGVLAANEVTLQAGTYRFTGWSNAYNVTNSQIRLWNNTAAAVVAYGRCAISSGTSTQFLEVEGRFTIGVASAIRMEAQCSVTEATDGFGRALGFGGTEVYAGLEFIKE